MATVREGGSREMAVTVLGRHQNPAYGDQTIFVRPEQVPQRMCPLFSVNDLELGGAGLKLWVVSGSDCRIWRGEL